MSRRYRNPEQWLELPAVFAQSSQTQAPFYTEHGRVTQPTEFSNPYHNVSLTM